MNQPQIIDTKLAAAHQIAFGLRSQIASKLRSIEFYESKNYSYSEREIAGLKLAIATLETQLRPVQAEISELNAQYTGWTRAFLVANNGGHVHSSTSCSTCFATTDFIWLPEWSGKDEAEIIDAAGSSACSVCFPNAPVESLRKASIIEDPARVAAREERAAKAAAKKAKEILTGISNPDGSPLKVRGWIIKTERTAEIEGVDSLVWNIYYPEGGNFAQNAADAQKVAEALAFKRDSTPEEQLELMAAKAAKKASKR